MENNRCIYVILTRTNTIISKLIHMITNDEYTHASISLDFELKDMYSFSRRNTYNPFIGGFKKEEVDKGVYGGHREIPCTILKLEISQEQYYNAKNMIDEFKFNSDRYKYNYRGLADNLLKKEKYDRNRFLCSEFVYHILEKSKIVDLNIPRNLVRPQNLCSLKSEIIYKGNLKSFGNVNNNINEYEASVGRLSLI